MIETLPVLLYGAPELRDIAQDVTCFDGELRTLVQQMTATMLKYDGLGLAAPQVGQNRRIIIIRDGEKTLPLINPRITNQSASEVWVEEGCLSIPNVLVRILRPAHIHLDAVDEFGRPIFLAGYGMLARIIQHECDHLDGKLIIDYLSPLKRKAALREFARR